MKLKYTTLSVRLLASSYDMNRSPLEAYGVWVTLSQYFVQLLVGLSTFQHIYK
jgi:hypothetical protein